MYEKPLTEIYIIQLKGFPIKIDTSRSAIKIIEDTSQLSVVDLVESHNTGTKDMLKSKWKEITSSA